MKHLKLNCNYYLNNYLIHNQEHEEIRKLSEKEKLEFYEYCIIEYDKSNVGYQVLILGCPKDYKYMGYLKLLSL